jgi:hypothetical protein
MYAVDRTRMPEILAVLRECGFSPADDVRSYPGDPGQVGARNALHKLVAEAREAAIEPSQRGADVVRPVDLVPVPGARTARGPEDVEEKKAAEPELPPLVTLDEVRKLVDIAISDDKDLEMVYVAKTGQRLALVVQPQRIAFKVDSPVLVGLDRADDERRSFVLDKIERLRMVEAPNAAE